MRDFGALRPDFFADFVAGFFRLMFVGYSHFRLEYDLLNTDYN